MFDLFFFKKIKINKEYLELSHIAYGGELHLKLNKFKLKEFNIKSTALKIIPDAILSKKDNKKYFSYKNETSGFSANVYENIKNKDIVIAYRGTERTDFGENAFDIVNWGKDILTDINLITGIVDRQFEDAWELYKCISEQNTKSKIILTGHSLGGALAQLAAARAYSLTAKNKKPVKLETYTYNAPGCRHLLQLFNCDTSLNYSFIKNYAVMNDWCGMFGDKIGETYLIEPIPLKVLENNSPLNTLNNILLTTHEGIFEYDEKLNGKIIKKPDNFNQDEGLSLWYYDINNPLKNYNKISDFAVSISPKIQLPDVSGISRSFKDAAEKFFDEHSTMIQNMEFSSKHSIAVIRRPFRKLARKFKKHALPAAEKFKISSLNFKNSENILPDLKTVFKDKITNNIQNNIIISLTNLLETTVKNVSLKSLENALYVINKVTDKSKQKQYINDMKKVLNSIER